MDHWLSQRIILKWDAGKQRLSVFRNQAAANNILHIKVHHWLTACEGIWHDSKCTTKRGL